MGDVTLEAFGQSATSATAIASASGQDKDDTGADTNGDGTDDGTGVTALVDQERNAADTQATDNGGQGAATTPTPEAKTNSGGPINVAAAVGVNIANTESVAAIPFGITVTSGGKVAVRTSANTDASASANGATSIDPESTGTSKVGVGVAVAINVANVDNRATVDGKVVAAGGLEISAVMTDFMGDETQTFGAEAVSGSSGSDVGIALSLGLNIVNIRTVAEISATGDVTLTGGDMRIEAAAFSDSDTSATPTAAVDKDATLKVNISGNVDVLANGGHNMVTRAEAGASGAVAIVPSIAIAISNIDRIARISGDGTNDTLNLLGSLTIAGRAPPSDNTVLTTAKGSAESNGGSAAVGVALALSIVNHTIIGSLDRSVTANGSISVEAIGRSRTISDATASAVGSPGSGETGAQDEGGSGNVDSQVQGERDVASQQQMDAGGRGDVNPIGGLVINANDSVTVRSSANNDSQTIANGQGKTKGGSAGIGAAVAVNVHNVDNLATIGDSQVTANGVNVEALMTVSELDEVRHFDGTDWVVVASGTELPTNTLWQYDKPENTPTDQDNKDPVWNEVPTGEVLPDEDPSAPFEADDAFLLTAQDGTNAPGVYKWNDTTNVFVLDTDIPLDGVVINSVTELPLTGHSSGDLIRLTESQFIGLLKPGVYKSNGLTWSLVLEEGVDFPKGTLGFDIPLIGALGEPSDQDLFRMTPANDALFRLTEDDGTNVAGVYKYNQDLKVWELQLSVYPTGAFLPENPTAGDFFRLLEHESTAITTAGAGGDKVGIGGAVSVNVANINTTAEIQGGAVIQAGIGTSNIEAQSNNREEATAKANAKGGKAGVGVGVAVNVLTPITRAEIANTASFTGSEALTVKASARQLTDATGSAGSASSGGVAVSPAVAVTVSLAQTTARIGTHTTDDLVATGAVVVEANYSTTSAVMADAKAGGKNVAVGAAIAVNVVKPTTLAEVARNLQGASVAVRANSEVLTSADTKAGAAGSSNKGNSDGQGQNTADAQAENEVSSNPNTTGTTTVPDGQDGVDQGNTESSSQTGSSGSGIGVGAAISVNVVIETNKAFITGAITVTGTTGAVDVNAENHTDGQVKAIGTALVKKAKANVGVAISVNVVTVHNYATISQGATVNGVGASLTATTTEGETNEFVAWALAAAGGTQSNVSVGGSIGVQVITLENIASTGNGVTINAGAGDFTGAASAPIGLQNLALGVALGKTAVGAAVAVNVLNIETKVFVESGTAITERSHVDALGEINFDATSTISPVTLFEGQVPILGDIDIKVSSIGFGGALSNGKLAIGGSVVVTVINSTTQAYIAKHARINQAVGSASGQHIKLNAVDKTTLFNAAGGLGGSTGSVGIGAGILVDVITKDTRAYLGAGVVANAGGDVDITTTSGEKLEGFAATIGASAKAGISASIVVAVLNTGTRSYIESTTADPSTVLAEGSMTISAVHNEKNIADPDKTFLLAGGLAFGGKAGIGVSVVVHVNNEVTEAFIGDRLTPGASSAGQIQAWGGLNVTADQNDDLFLLGVAGAGGGSAGIAGSATVNTVSAETTAFIGAGITVNQSQAGAELGQDVNVGATNTTTLFGLAGALAIGGSAGVGAGIDVEVVNKTTKAWIGADTTVSARRNITVDAISNEKVTTVSVGASFAGSAAISINATVPVFNITTTADIGTGAIVRADGSVRVEADEDLKLDVIGGNISGGGSAAVGAAVAVPIVTKTTTARIGNNAQVSGAGNNALTVKTGDFQVTTQDTRFDPNGAITGGDTIDLGYNHGFEVGDELLYDAGGADENGDASAVQISGLEDGAVYYVLATPTATSVKLERVVAFAASAAAGTTLNLGYNHGFSDGQAVRYSPGSNSDDAIIGLNDEDTFFVKVLTPTSVQLFTDPGLDAEGLPIDPLERRCGLHGRNHRLSPTNFAIVREDKSPRFDPAQDVAGNTITLPYQLVNPDGSPVATGDPVVYSSASGAPIGGLIDGGQYYAIVVSTGANQTVLRLAATECETGTGTYDPTPEEPENGDEGTACPTVVLPLDKSMATGRSHSIVVHGSTPAGDASAVGPRTIENQDTVFRGVAVTATNSDDLAAVGISAAIAGAAAVALAGSVEVSERDHLGHVTPGPTPAPTLSSRPVTTSPSIPTLTHDSYRSLPPWLAATWASVQQVGVTTGDVSTRAFAGRDNTIDARAVGATLNGFGGVAVTATSSEDIFGLVPAIGGGFVGVAGGVSVTLINVLTEAIIGDNADVNGKAVGASDQSVNVIATDSAKSLTIAGGAAGGFVGVAGGVDIGTLAISVNASIGTSGFGDAIRAVEDVNVQAFSTKQLQTFALSFGAGAVGVAGSVSVWGLGTEGTTTYEDDAGGDFQGTWVNGGIYNQGDVVQDPVDGNRYTAKKDFLGTGSSPASTTAPRLDSGSDTSGWAKSTQEPLKGDDTLEAAWNAGTTYDAGQAVSYNGKNYSSRTDDNMGNEPDISPEHWNEAKGSATGDADVVASGDGGYKNALDGTSNVDKGAWVSGSDYDKGDHVTFGDQSFVATKDITNSTVDPVSNIAGPAASRVWSEIAKSDTVLNERLVDVLDVAKTDLNNAGPGASVTTNPLSAGLTPGTTVSVGATIEAGGGINITANEDLDLFGIAGAIAAGAVGIGIAVLVLTVDSNVEAHVTSAARLGATNGKITVAATHTEKTRAIAFGGQGGVVAIGGQVAVLNDTAVQNAHIDSGAAITEAGAGLDVQATTTRDVDSFVIGVSLGVVAAGVAISVVNLDGDASATVGDVAVATAGVVDSITVNAAADITPTSEVYSVQAGVGFGASGAVALLKLEGTTRAELGAHGTVGAGGVHVTANGTHDSVKVLTINVATGLGGAVGVTVAQARNYRNTEAEVTSTADLDVIGDVFVTSDSSLGAFADAPGGAGGLIAVAVMLPLAKVTGRTTAFVNGRFSNSDSATVEATGKNVAKASALVFSVSLGGASGAYAKAEISSTANVESGLGSDASINSDGAVVIGSKLLAPNNVNARALGFAGALIGGVSVMVADATTAGAVRTTVDGNVEGSSSLTIASTGGNIANARTIAAGLGLIGIGIGASGTVAKITNTADVATTVTGDLTTAGNLNVTAAGPNLADSESDTAGGGFAGGALTILKSEIAGAVTVAMSGNVTKTGAANTAGQLATGADVKAEVTAGTWATAGSAIHVHANSSGNTATTSAVGVSAGIGIGISAIVAESFIDGAVRAKFAAQVTASRSFKVEADGGNDVDANTPVVAVGAVGIGISKTTAIIGAEADVSATKIGSTTTNGAFEVNAAGGNTADVTTTMVSVGVVGVAGSGFSATIAGDVTATSSGNVSGASGTAKVIATGGNTANAKSTSVTVGLIGVNVADPNNPTSDEIDAAEQATDDNNLEDGDAGAGASILIGADVVAEVTGGTWTVPNAQIEVAATGTNTANAESRGVGVALVAVNSISATATIGGEVRASFNGTVTGSSGFSVTATGGNTVDATTPVTAVGLGAINFSQTKALILDEADVSASKSGSTTTTGSFEVVATGGNSATVNSKMVAVGFVGVNGSGLLAQIDGSVSATSAGNVSGASGTAKRTGVALVAVNVIIAKAELGGAVRAALGATISGSASITVDADGKNDVDANTPVVAVGLIAISTSQTNAVILSSADVSATKSGNAVTTGSFEVNAAGGNTADVTTQIVSVGVGAVAGSGFAASISGDVTASSSGDLSGASGTAKVLATGGNTANAKSTSVSIGLVSVNVATPGSPTNAEIDAAEQATADEGAADGDAGAGASIQIGADVVAEVTSGTWTVPNAQIEVAATGTNTANAESRGVGVALVAVNSISATATIGGAVEAAFAGTVAGSSKFAVKATGGNTVDAQTPVTAVGLGAINFSQTKALILDEADVTAAKSGATTTTGTFEVAATGGNLATVTSQMVAVGFVGVNGSGLLAEIDGAVSATSAGNVTSASGTAKVTALGGNKASATSSSIAVGLVTVNAGDTTDEAEAEGPGDAGATARIAAGADVAAEVTSGTWNTPAAAITITANGKHANGGIGNSAVSRAEGIGVGLVAVNVVLAHAEIGGAVRATSAANVTGSAGFVIDADGANTVDAQLPATSIGLVAISVSSATTDITMHADVIASKTGAVTTTGAFEINANGTNSATSNSTLVAVGLVSVSDTGINAEISGGVVATSAGNLSGSAGTANVIAVGVNTATATAEATEIGLVSAGSSSTNANISSSAAVIAEVISGAWSVANTVIMVKATGTNTATALTDGVSVGAVSLQSMSPTATVGGEVEAEFTATMPVAAASLTVQARSNNQATATNNLVNVGLVAADTGSASNATITSGAKTQAIVGAAGSIDVTGDVLIDAQTNQSNGNKAKALITTTGAGVVSVAFIESVAKVEAATEAHLDGSVTGASKVHGAREVKERRRRRRNVKSFGIAGLGGGAANALITGAADTSARIRGSVTVSGAGIIDVKAESNNNVDAYTDVASGGIVGVASSEAACPVSAATTAVSDASGASTSAGAVAVSNVAPVAKSDVQTSIVFNADVGTDDNVGASSLKIDAKSDEFTKSAVVGKSFGAVAVGSSTVTASTEGDVSVEVGGSQIIVTNNITIDALAKTDADARASSVGGGAVKVSGLTTKATVDPDVNITVNTTKLTSTSGDVAIKARHGGALVQLSDGTITGVNDGNDTVSFSAPHGLNTGDTVVYEASGSTITGLDNAQAYLIIEGATDSTLSFGVDLGNASFNTTTSNFDFDGPHNLQDGQVVKYTATAGVVPGLTPGNSYVVVLVNDNSFKLKAQGTTGNSRTFNPSTGIDTNGTPATLERAVISSADNNILINGHGFSNNDVVTYHAPNKDQQFIGDFVDVNLIQVPGEAAGVLSPERNAAGQVDHSTNNNIIFLPNHGFAVAEIVRYNQPSGGSALVGLSNNSTYIVDVLSADSIRLLDVGLNVVGITPSSAGGLHTLTPTNAFPAGGLIDGNAYLIDLIDANTFALKTFTGGTVNLTNVAIGSTIGGHRLSEDALLSGAQLGAAPGTGHNLIINLSGSLPGGTHKLNGVGSPTAQIGALGANDLPTATATGTGGGIVSVGNADSTVTSSPIVKTDVASDSTISGQNVVIDAISTATGLAQTSDKNYGLVAVGNAKARVNITNQTTTTVLGSITAVEDVEIFSTNFEQGTADSSSKGGGFVGFASSDGRVDSDYDNDVAVRGGTIKAGRTILIESRSGLDHLNVGYANGAGLGANASTNDDSDSRRVNQSGQGIFVAGDTDTAVGSKLDAQNVNINAVAGDQNAVDANGDVVDVELVDATQLVVSKYKIFADSYAKASALGADSDASAKIMLNEDTEGNARSSRPYLRRQRHDQVTPRGL
ncbi:hypothetical protein GQR58_029240 [Nymphon striatum]|nr:hypothetical protein GQR58_029240 [Nymphon striatum]